ncbi:uncharacterized protein L201_008089 [Kwoniella dendrophila CBS 6074]|uniref:GATA-type domain-containing protein n=1 Tax=Kwoniella dendrophila CBS 6074 TaxID=1295534 RepID=A0AAX4K665_9TREE
MKPNNPYYQYYGNYPAYKYGYSSQSQSYASSSSKTTNNPSQSSSYQPTIDQDQASSSSYIYRSNPDSTSSDQTTTNALEPNSYTYSFPSSEINYTSLSGDDPSKLGEITWGNSNWTSQTPFQRHQWINPYPVQIPNTGTQIHPITGQNTVIHWQCYGCRLRRNEKDGYSWCANCKQYTYTVAYHGA